jgi:hypothetical protein
MAKIVQFIHPGPEHGYDEIVKEKKHKKWNSNNHQRKFCRGNGNFIDENGNNEFGDFRFWGEWEPPSFVDTTGQKSPSPKFLHSPYLPVNISGKRIITGSQNTDPCVFGEYFKYFICQQIRSNGKLTQMSKMDEGDMILFGSMKNKKFTFDTVFVVDGTVEVFNVEPEYNDISINRIANYSSTGCKIFRGKTFQNNKDLFSFTPASYNCFERIEVPIGLPLLLNNYITHNLTQGRRVSVVDHETVQKVWNELKSITLNKGLFLAHKIEWPKNVCADQKDMNKSSKC